MRRDLETRVARLEGLPPRGPRDSAWDVELLNCHELHEVVRLVDLVEAHDGHEAALPPRDRSKAVAPPLRRWRGTLVPWPTACRTPLS